VAQLFRFARYGRGRYLILVLVTALTVVATLVTPSVAARAATPPSGNLVVTVDPGISYDRAAMQQLINQVQGENGQLSDTFKRVVGEFPPPVAAGSADTQAFTTSYDWQDFKGTISETSDSAGLSITIPSDEVSSSATIWQNAAASIVGVGVWMLVRVGCVATAGAILGPPLAVAAKTFCASAAGFLGGFTRGVILQAFDHTLGDRAAWANTVISGLFAATASGLWEAGINKWAENTLSDYVKRVGQWIATNGVNTWSWLGTTFTGALQSAGAWLSDVAGYIPGAARAASPPTSASGPSCDSYGFYGTPCAEAVSTTRALFSTYGGPLYQVQRASDNITADIKPVAPGGYANSGQQDSFCANTSCVITKVYDQSYNWNDLTVEGAGSAAGADHAADAAALPVTLSGHKVYGIDVTGQVGYRDNTTNNIAVNGQPEGMYMVASGTHVNSGCCFDFGNAETNTTDTGNGHMDAVNLGTECYFPPCAGGGPWVEADLENGLFSGANGSNLANKGNGSNFVTALLKNNGQTTYAIKGGDAQTGGLSTWWDGALPNLAGYKPMQQEGAVVLGTGGDNSNWSVGSFFEGVMTQGYPSDAADNAAQANIVSAGYAGNSAGSVGGQTGSAIPTAGQAVLHDKYTSVYTVDSANNHLQESYLSGMGANWISQDLSTKYGAPPVLAGTQPVAITHSGYTSVYTIDAGSNDLQETYLSGLGANWITQDLTLKYGAPVSDQTPTAVVHDGYTSLYSVDSNSGQGGDLQETYLTAIGQPWHTQDLSQNYGTPKLLAGTSPVAVVHGGYTSVYTVNGNNHHLQETYLSALGANWISQDLSVNYGTPATISTPTAVVHDGYTSVYTVDDPSNDLQETYLANIGAPWATQDMSTKYGTPQVEPGTHPVAMVHTGYTSVYTADQNTNDVQETYLTDIGAPWATQDLTTKYGTPTTAATPIALLHPAADGSLTWSSVYTINEFNDHLQETYLSGIGANWITQDLSTKYGTPPALVAATGTNQWSAIHDGYTSVYTVDKDTNHLQETFLTTLGQPWQTQDLSAKYGTPAVRPQTIPIVITHDGYTSVFTVDANNDVQETYLSGIGANWITQDLTTKYNIPGVATLTSPSAVYNHGHTYLFTVNAANHDLESSVLDLIGGPWVSNDLTSGSGAPSVTATSSPAAVVHSGWVSVYTIDNSNNHLQETYLAATGGTWTSQDLSAKYGTPTDENANSPAAVVHSGWTSVYTVDNNGDLQETYLPGIGDAWITQDLSSKYGTPAVATANPPVPIYHTGYTSIYTIDASNHHVQETFLGGIGQAWISQDLTTKYGTPAADQAPTAVLHYDTNGAQTYTSIYTVDQGTDDLQETYLPSIGANWITQDFTTKYGTPAV